GTRLRRRLWYRVALGHIVVGLMYANLLCSLSLVHDVFACLSRVSMLDYLFWVGFCSVFFFFFQAEDGIRDATVTGVQTCALPIFDEGFRALHVGRSARRFRRGTELPHAEQAHHGTVILHHPILLGGPADMEEIRLRSEERRVGQECRPRWRRADGKRRNGQRTLAA